MRNKCQPKVSAIPPRQYCSQRFHMKPTYQLLKAAFEHKPAFRVAPLTPERVYLGGSDFGLLSAFAIDGHLELQSLL